MGTCKYINHRESFEDFGIINGYYSCLNEYTKFCEHKRSRSHLTFDPGHS